MCANPFRAIGGAESRRPGRLPGPARAAGKAGRALIAVALEKGTTHASHLFLLARGWREIVIGAGRGDLGRGFLGPNDEVVAFGQARRVDGGVAVDGRRAGRCPFGNLLATAVGMVDP